MSDSMFGFVPSKEAVELRKMALKKYESLPIEFRANDMDKERSITIIMEKLRGKQVYL